MSGAATTYTAPIKDRIAAARARGRSWSDIASLLEAITGDEHTADRLSAAASHWRRQGDPRFAEKETPALPGAPEDPAPEPIAAPMPRPSFADYQPKMCQYPLWGDDARFGERAFCGHRISAEGIEKGSPYCERHATRCYKQRPVPQNAAAQC